MTSILQFPKKVVEKVKEKRTRGKSRNDGYNIRERGPTSFLLRVYDCNGKVGFTKTYPTYHDANSEGAKIRADFVSQKHGGRILEDHRSKKLKEYTFRDITEAYIAHCTDHEFVGIQERHKCFFSVEVPYLRRVMVEQSWLFDLKLTELQSREVWERQRDERYKGLNGVPKATARTWHREYTILAYILYTYARDAHPDRLTITKPEFAKPEKKAKKKTRALEPGEFEKVLAEIRKSSRPWVRVQYSLMWHWLHETCVRPGAICLITWQDISWNNHSYMQPAEKKSDTREIPFSPAMMERVTGYYKLLEKVAPEMAKPNKPVFWLWGHANKGTCYSESQLSDTFREFFARAGVTNFWLHLMRHTAMNKYLDMDMDPRDVEYLAGHQVGKERANPTYYHGCIRRIRNIIGDGRSAVQQWHPANAQSMSEAEQAFIKMVDDNNGHLAKHHKELGATVMRAEFDNGPAKVQAELTIDKLAELAGCTTDEFKQRFRITKEDIESGRVTIKD